MTRGVWAVTCVVTFLPKAPSPYPPRGPAKHPAGPGAVRDGVEQRPRSTLTSAECRPLCARRRPAGSLAEASDGAALPAVVGPGPPVEHGPAQQRRARSPNGAASTMKPPSGISGGLPATLATRRRRRQIAPRQFIKGLAPRHASVVSGASRLGRLGASANPAGGGGAGPGVGPPFACSKCCKICCVKFLTSESHLWLVRFGARP